MEKGPKEVDPVSKWETEFILKMVQYYINRYGEWVLEHPAVTELLDELHKRGW